MQKSDRMQKAKNAELRKTLKVSNKKQKRIAHPKTSEDVVVQKNSKITLTQTHNIKHNSTFYKLITDTQ